MLQESKPLLGALPAEVSDVELNGMLEIVGAPPHKAYYYRSLFSTRMEEVRMVCEVNPSLLGLWAWGYPQIARQRYEPREVLGVLKSAARAQGLSKAGWKYLARLDPAMCVPLMHAGGSLQVILSRINLMARIQYTPRSLQAFEWVLRLPGVFDRAQDEQVAELYAVAARALFREADTRPAKQVRRFLREEATLVFDWVMQARPVLDRNQKTAPWSWFMVRQRLWHEREVVRRAARQADATPGAGSNWGSLLGEVVVNGFKVVPLTDSEQLHEEGQEMHHCVGGYTSQCTRGTSRIFSIRSAEDRRLSTLEIAMDHSGKWVVQQHFGPCNERVDVPLMEVGLMACRLYNEAEKRNSYSLASLDDSEGATR